MQTQHACASEWIIANGESEICDLRFLAQRGLGVTYEKPYSSTSGV